MGTTERYDVAVVGAGIIGAVTEPTTVLGGTSLFLGMGAAALGTARTLWARGTHRFRARFRALFDAVCREVDASTEDRRVRGEAEPG